MLSLSSVTIAPSSMGLPTMLGQHDVVLPPPLTPRCSPCVLGHASVPQQQPASLMPLQACANYAMGSPLVGFFFRVEPPTVFYIICLVSVLVSAFYFGGCSGVCFLLSGAILDAIFTLGRLNHWGLHYCNPWSLPMAGICATW